MSINWDDPRAAAQATTADIVADTERIFDEALERLEGELNRLADWAAERDRAERGDFLTAAAGSVRAARRLGS